MTIKGEQKNQTKRELKPGTRIRRQPEAYYGNAVNHAINNHKHTWTINIWLSKLSILKQREEAESVKNTQYNQ